MKSIIAFDKELEQKNLFFQINDFFEEKISGLYSIHKDDICLYVGQSTNLASRAATHLKGKYENCDAIYLYIDEEDDGDLLIHEKILMKRLKPIENVLVDFTEDICCSSSNYYNKPSVAMINEEYHLAIIRKFEINLFTSDKLRNVLTSMISHVDKYKD